MGLGESDFTEEYRDESGLLHKEDGPALVGKNGSKEWWIHGKRHREDGPAIESSVQKAWCIDNQYHRENDLPAIEIYEFDKVVDQQWWLHGKLHREGNKPTVIRYRDDKEEHWYQTKGSKHLHRENGPVLIVYHNGVIVRQEWQLNGFHHRIDGPAFISADTEVWCRNGNYYREDGPAVIINNVNDEEIYRILNPINVGRVSAGKRIFWYTNQGDTEEIEQWIIDNKLPHWTNWTNKEKVLFKLRWC